MKFPRKSLFIFYAASCILFFAGCKKDQPVPAINYGYNYFPNNLRHWVVYHCDSMVYNAFNDSIYSYHYYLKEEIAGADSPVHPHLVKPHAVAPGNGGIASFDRGRAS